MKKKRFSLKLGQAAQITQALNKFLNSDFSAKDSFAIARILQALASHPDVIAAETTRRKLIGRYGEDTGNGNVQVIPSKIPLFLEDYSQVAEQNLEVELPILELSLLEKAPNMSPGDMLALNLLFEKEEEEIVEVEVADRNHN